MLNKQSSSYIRDNGIQTRITFTQLSLYLLMLFPITTLLQGYIGIINKLLFGLSLIVLFISITYKANRQTFVIGASALALHFWAGMLSRFPLDNFNDIFYFAFWIMLVVLLGNKKEDIDELIVKSKVYITVVVTVWSLLIAAAMVIPSSYQGVYFKPFRLSGFRSAPTAIFILTLILVLIVYFKNKAYVYLSVFPMYVLLMGNSRTYLGVGMLLFAIIWYILCEKSDKFFLTAIPIAIIGILLFQFTGINTKVEETTWSQDSYFDYWGTITNGRSIFWEYDMKMFFRSNFIKQLFGSGFNRIYDLNQIAAHTRIWAHNDFIQMLTSHGYCGLALYMYIYYHLCKNILMKNKTKIPVIVFLMFMFVWLVNAFFNMFYTYICSAISYPFIAFALNKYFSEKSSNGEALFFAARSKGKKDKPKSKYIR